MTDACHCGERSVILSPGRCQVHFIEEFEARTKRTLIEECGIEKGQRVLVACSGGKDSMVCLDLLHRWSSELEITVDALAIDEGIEGYRDRTLDHLRSFCEDTGIRLKVMSFSRDRNVVFTNLIDKNQEKSICAPCGVLRRSLLNEGATGYDILATGHNMDDESQSVMMNLIKANHWLLARTGARTGPSDRKGFVPRIKPLFFCAEREVAIYAHLRNLRPSFEECPHARKSFRAVVRTWINDQEVSQPGFKERLLRNALGWKNTMIETTSGHAKAGEELHTCETCGQPCRKRICASCAIVGRVAI